MRFTIKYRTGDRIAPDAFANNIGKTIRANAGTTTVDGEVISAVVAEDGMSVDITLEVPDVFGALVADAPATQVGGGS